MSRTLAGFPSIVHADAALFAVAPAFTLVGRAPSSEGSPASGSSGTDWRARIGLSFCASGPTSAAAGAGCANNGKAKPRMRTVAIVEDLDRALAMTTLL